MSTDQLTNKLTTKSEHTSGKSAALQTFPTAILMTTLFIATLSHAHAEQYCKSVDKDGNATYTLATDRGCSSKKIKTIAIHRPPSSVTVPVVTAKSDAVKTDIAALAESPKVGTPPSALAADQSIQLSQDQNK